MNFSESKHSTRTHLHVISSCDFPMISKASDNCFSNCCSEANCLRSANDKSTVLIAFYLPLSKMF